MWTPNTIIEWIEERISFMENFIFNSSIKEIPYDNSNQIRDFTLQLENFKYCKKLYFELLENSNEYDIKKRFKNISNKLIFDTIYSLDKVEFKCIYIHEFCFPTKEKDILPQESIDNISKNRLALEKIFYQVQQLCGGNF